MTRFSNPAGATTRNVAEYVTAVLALLGDRDPIEVLRATPEALEDSVANVPAAALTEPEENGKWSIAEVCQHLADSEIVWSYRLRMVLAEDKPHLVGYDQDVWADRFGYRDVPVGESLALFSAARKSNLRLLARLTPSDYRRVGRHNERGQESVRDLVALYAGHDLVHLGQVERIRQRLGIT